MPYSTKVIDKKDYLLFIIGGDATTLDEVITHAEFIVLQARKLNHTRLLLDETALVMNLDAHDVIMFADWFAGAHVIHLGLRAAVVCTPENCAMIRSFETALQNRSINYRMFTDTKPAEAWLKSSQAI